MLMTSVVGIDVTRAFGSGDFGLSVRASISDRDLRCVSQKRNLSLLYQKRFLEIIHETSLSNISYVSEKRTSDPACLFTGSIGD